MFGMLSVRRVFYSWRRG